MQSLNDLSPRARTLLETALVGESDAVKAQVLQLVLEGGIRPDEEFFLISIGLNHIKVLLHDAPTQLQTWSTAFQQELDAWAGSYIQTLHIIAQKAEATAALTETAGQLATMLTSHTQSCNALIKQLQAAHHAWGDSWDQQADVNQTLLESFSTLSEAIERQTKQLHSLTAEVKASRRSDPLMALGLRPGGWKQAVYAMAAFSLIIGSMAMTVMAVFYVQDRPQQQKTAERVEYLLQKQNRRDCLEGVKGADSPECQM